MTETTKTVTVTMHGHTYDATSDGASVTIGCDGEYAGTGRWDAEGQCITDCDAILVDNEDLGAGLDQNSEVYEALADELGGFAAATSEPNPTTAGTISEDWLDSAQQNASMVATVETLFCAVGNYRGVDIGSSREVWAYDSTWAGHWLNQARIDEICARIDRGI